MSKDGTRDLIIRRLVGSNQRPPSRLFSNVTFLPSVLLGRRKRKSLLPLFASIEVFGRRSDQSGFDAVRVASGDDSIARKCW